MKKALLPLALALSFAAALPATAAEIYLINQDAGLGTGLDDPTPRAPAGGNSGTTLGQQRQVAYFYAAQMWGAVVKSSTPIYVGARFIPQTCTATSAVLGSAGSTGAWVNVPGGIPGVIYGQALGDALYGADLDPGFIDIQSQFNSNINGNPACLGGSQWYYGLDGKTPAGQINFLNVVMHEISHGLGFASFMNVSTGAMLGNFPDAYLINTYNNTRTKSFQTMTNIERRDSVRDNGNTVWTGANVTANVPAFLDARFALQVTAPSPLQGYLTAFRTALGPVPTATNFVGTIAVANDGVGTGSDACEAIPAGSLAGKVAIVDRGTCNFDVKVLNAQAAGAKAVVIANNVAGDFAPGGSNVAITIPAIGVLQADGATLRSVANVQVRAAYDPVLKDGADNAGRARLYAPTVLASGSTYSHFDIALSPNALMEPSITDTLRGDIDVDLTPALFKDIGWSLNAGGAKMGTCDTLVPTVTNDGLAVGAHVIANSAVCDAFAPTRAAYMTCTTNNSKKLVAAGLINNTQASKIVLCANQWSATRY